MARLLVVSRSMALAMRLADAHEVIEHQVDAIDGLTAPVDVDVVVLDVGEPTMAIHALDQLRTDGDTTPVLIVSGYQPAWASLVSVDIPGVMVVPLPITRAALLEGVRELARLTPRRDPLPTVGDEQEPSGRDEQEPEPEQLGWQEPPDWLRSAPEQVPPAADMQPLPDDASPDARVDPPSAAEPERCDELDDESVDEVDPPVCAETRAEAETWAEADAGEVDAGEVDEAGEAAPVGGSRDLEHVETDAEIHDVVAAGVPGVVTAQADAEVTAGGADNPVVDAGADDGDITDQALTDQGPSPGWDELIAPAGSATTEAGPAWSPPWMRRSGPRGPILHVREHGGGIGEVNADHWSVEAAPGPTPESTRASQPADLPPPLPPDLPQPPPLPTRVTAATPAPPSRPPVPHGLPDVPQPPPLPTRPAVASPPLPPALPQPPPLPADPAQQPVSRPQTGGWPDVPAAPAAATPPAPPALGSTDTRSLILAYPPEGGSPLGAPSGWANQDFDWWFTERSLDAHSTDEVAEECAIDRAREPDPQSPLTDTGDPDRAEDHAAEGIRTGPAVAGEGDEPVPQVETAQPLPSLGTNAPVPEVETTEPVPEVDTGEREQMPEPHHRRPAPAALALSRGLLGLPRRTHGSTELDHRLVSVPFQTSAGQAGGTSAEPAPLPVPEDLAAEPGEAEADSEPGLDDRPVDTPLALSTADLVECISERVSELFGVCDTAQMLADEIVEIADADAAAVLVPDGGLWRVSGGVGLRPPERRLILDAGHWLVSEIAVGGRALLVEDTDIVRPKLAGAPLAAWRHLLAIPIPEVRSAVVLARGYESGAFSEHDLGAVVEPVRRSVSLMRTALQIRHVARLLAPLREIDPSH